MIGSLCFRPAFLSQRWLAAGVLRPFPTRRSSDLLAATRRQSSCPRAGSDSCPWLQNALRPRASTPVTTLIATPAQAPICHRALAAARAYALSRGSSAARRRRIVHHRTSSSSGSIPHDRQPVLPPRLPLSTLAGRRRPTPVPYTTLFRSSRGDAASIILPPSRIGQLPLAAECIAAPSIDAGDDADCNASAGADLPPCPCCGSRLRIIERFQRGETPTHRPSPHQLVFRFNTS